MNSQQRQFREFCLERYILVFRRIYFKVIFLKFTLFRHIWYVLRAEHHDIRPMICKDKKQEPLENFRFPWLDVLGKWPCVENDILAKKIIIKAKCTLDEGSWATYLALGRYFMSSKLFDSADFKSHKLLCIDQKFSCWYFFSKDPLQIQKWFAGIFPKNKVIHLSQVFSYWRAVTEWNISGDQSLNSFGKYVHLWDHCHKSISTITSIAKQTFSSYSEWKTEWKPHYDV